MSEVAIAMIECDGRWLLQLRDDTEGILYPGQWALFGGHLGVLRRYFPILFPIISF